MFQSTDGWLVFEHATSGCITTRFSGQQ